jgi:hypothetical protein
MISIKIFGLNVKKFNKQKLIWVQNTSNIILLFPKYI